MKQPVDERIKMPYFLKAFLLMYIGWFGVLHFKGGVNDSYILVKVISLTWLACMTGIFAYGVICLIVDVKKGGIAHIIKKIKRAFNGKF